MMRKGQLGNLQGIIIALVVIGIILGVSFYVLQEFRGTLVTGTATEVNETLTTVTEAGETVAKAGEPDFSMDTDSVVCCNVTSETVIESSGNYTATSAGVIAFVSSGNVSFNNSDWNCTYTYTFGEEAWEGVNETIQATMKIPGWLAIVVILLLVAIILAIVFGIFPGFGGGSVTKGAGKGFSRLSFGRGGSEGTAEV